MCGLGLRGWGLRFRVGESFGEEGVSGCAPWKATIPITPKLLVEPGAEWPRKGGFIRSGFVL